MVKVDQIGYQVDEHLPKRLTSSMIFRYIFIERSTCFKLPDQKDSLRLFMFPLIT